MGRNWYISYAPLGLGYQSSGDALVFFWKGCLRNESASPNFGGAKPSLPQLATHKERWSPSFKSEMMLFCFCFPPRSGGFIPFCNFRVLFLLKKGFHFKCVGSTSSWSVLHISANVWDSLLWEKPIRLTLLSGNLGFPSQESFLPFFMVEWGNYSIFFSKTRILETSHFLLRHDHRKI